MGDASSKPSTTARSPHVIVCHCRVVTDRTVVEAVREGAGSLARVCQQTGAGRDCGACVFSLKRLVCEHGLAPAAVSPAVSAVTIPEVDVAAS